MKDGWKLILGVALLLVAFGKTPLPGIIPPVVPFPPVVVEPDTSPFRSTGLTVLIVEDSTKRRDIPASQVSIFTSSKLDKHMDELGADFRVWNITEDGEHDKEVFRMAAKVPRASVPWIVIAHGKKGFSGPLPSTVDGVIALVDQYK